MYEGEDQPGENSLATSLSDLHEENTAQIVLLVLLIYLPRFRTRQRPPGDQCDPWGHFARVRVGNTPSLNRAATDTDPHAERMDLGAAAHAT